jgi:hypothetical protein
MTLETTSTTGAVDSTAAPALANDTTGAANPNDATATGAQTTELDPEAEKARESRNAQRRIDTLVRTRTEARTEAQLERQRREALEAEIQHLRGQGNRQPTNEEPAQGNLQREQRAPTQADIERIANERADQIASLREVGRRGSEIAAAGLKAYGEDFKSIAMTVMDEAGPLYQPNGLPTALGEAVHDAENPAALLHHLGSNPEIAESLRGLSAAALGRRVARIEAEMKPQEPRASRAPAPLKPPTGSQGSGGEPSADSPDFLAHKLKKLRGG